MHRAGQHPFCWPSGARDGRAPLIPCRELLRRQVAETRVRAQVVVVVPPPLDDLTRLPEAVNTYSLRHSSRNLLLNDSMNAFCTGLPGSM